MLLVILHVLLSLEISVCYSNLKPNIVLILTDDQDILLNGLKPMTKTRALLANKGVIFENSFANTPICCPSRSIILTGKYAHNLGVHNNSLSGNCSSIYWQKNHEPYTISSILKTEKSYVTFYAGKYLNQYGDKSVGGTKHIPKGYDWWIGLKGNSVYYNYVLSINGTAKYFGDEYLTDVLKNYALDFLNRKNVRESPFFMTIATPAPHQPFTPAERHKKFFPTTKALRTPSFNFSSGDKHWIVESPPKYLPSDVTLLDEFQKLRMQSLLAVDELVEALIEKLDSSQLLNNTYVIFTSDNGYHLGQFTLPYDKRQPYETDVRIPLIIRGPNVREKNVIRNSVSLVDLAATVSEIAGIDGNKYEMDGTSFLKIIKSNFSGDNSASNKIFIEYFGERNEGARHGDCDFIKDTNVSHCSKNAWCKCADSTNNTYACVITFGKNYLKFCQFDDRQNFIELYNLQSDPHELMNIYKKVKKSTIKYYQQLLKKFKNCKGNSCIN